MKSTKRPPRLVFHLGDPKTGTTTIQRVLHDRLVSCPTQEILPWTRLNAVAVANSLKSNPSVQRKEFRSIDKWLSRSDADVAVISSEFFASTRPLALKNALEKHVPADHYSDLSVISYVRPHASRFLAAFVQRTKTGRFFGDIDDFLATLQKNEPLTFNYSKRFGGWKSRFGDRFVLKPFIRSELRGGDIVEDFFDEVLRGAPFTIEEKIEANVSVTTKSLAGLQRMHEKLRDLGTDAKDRSIIGGAMGNVFLDSPHHTGEKPKLDRQTAQALISTFRNDAKKLDALFFSEPLMRDHLDRCVDNTGEEKLDLTAEVHFSPSELKSLDELSTEIAAGIRRYRRFWALNYHMKHRQVRNYMTLPTRVLLNLGPLSRRVKALDDRLEAVSDILGG